MQLTAIDFNAVRQDFKEILDLIETDKRRILEKFYNPQHIEAVIISNDTNVQLFKEIYNNGAKLVISTVDWEANGFIAKLKRYMTDPKYSSYHLEAHSYYTITVWPND